MPCRDILQDNTIPDKLQIVEAILCAVITELMQQLDPNISSDILEAAEKNGDLGGELQHWIVAHELHDKERLEYKMRSEFSEHELIAIKSMMLKGEL